MRNLQTNKPQKRKHDHEKPKQKIRDLEAWPQEIWEGEVTSPREYPKLQCRQNASKMQTERPLLEVREVP